MKGREPWKASVKTACFWIEIWTWDLINTRQKY